MSTDFTPPAGDPVSRFCFGTMQFGGKADATASQALYDASRAAGINFFDTADVYTDGTSETLLGGFAKAERDKLVIATKVGAVGGSSRDNILTRFDGCRSRLDMEYVDILYLHRWDDETPLEESIETLAELQQAGKIGAIGVSNYSAWQIMKAQAVAVSFATNISIFQPMYSLVKRQAEVEMLPMAQSEGFAVASYSPLGGGLLTGKYASGDGGRLVDDSMYKARYGVDWMHQAAKDLSVLAKDNDVDPATLAVAWVASNPAITSPIISARSVAQLAPSLAALEFDLGDDLKAQLSALTPTPAPATDRLEEV
ncbi:aldo/keto reductase [Parasedimentitalea psychrophila]|uniref:Aldo/keto reductase n=1 Tax=Parasedimentitalea psychrophila TaxID=2997337 RepID=A0A9Y2P5X2_9RHOB|nr:aldo/keto reductase [Parasedimentitalea psychrophila]WIY24408.1 aldo/keto reductase [Parasedimentitalea psychrophila]